MGGRAEASIRFRRGFEKGGKLVATKSRVSWLTTFDLNTKYFHLSTIIRRRRNSIENILSSMREWLKKRDSIGHHMVTFFQSLYTSPKPEWDEELEDLIQPVITFEENIQLYRIPTKEEIKSYVDEIEALKAPGPDGMSAIFYQFYWDTLHMDLVEMVQQFFKSGHLLRQLNHTFIFFFFLLKVLKCFGFNGRWISWVEQCLTTVFFFQSC